MKIYVSDSMIENLYAEDVMESEMEYYWLDFVVHVVCYDQVLCQFRASKD